MKPVMYLFVNNSLGMSPGKIAAQASHAAVEAYRLSSGDRTPTVIHRPAEERTALLTHWLNTGYTKLVMEARDTEHLLNIERYLTEKLFNTFLVIDEGRTEIDPHTPTALGVEVVDKDDELVQFAFSDFRTLKPPKQEKKRNILGR